MYKNSMRELFLSYSDLSSSTNKNYDKLRKESIVVMDKVLEQMPYQLQEKLDDYLDADAAKGFELNCLSFEKGFALAVQLIFDALSFDIDKLDK